MHHKDRIYRLRNNSRQAKATVHRIKVLAVLDNHLVDLVNQVAVLVAVHRSNTVHQVKVKADLAVVVVVVVSVVALDKVVVLRNNTDHPDNHRLEVSDKEEVHRNNMVHHHNRNRNSVHRPLNMVHQHSNKAAADHHLRNMVHHNKAVAAVSVIHTFVI